MSRARILADYVSSGDELAVTTATADAALPKAGGAMTGAITTNSTFDGVDIAARDAIHAPLADPTFTGTVAIPNVANLETAVVANTAKVTNYNQTLADINALDITELGTVTSGVLEDSVTYRNINQDLASTDSPTFNNLSVSQIEGSTHYRSNFFDIFPSYNYGATAVLNTSGTSWVNVADIQGVWSSGKSIFDSGKLMASPPAGFTEELWIHFSGGVGSGTAYLNWKFAFNSGDSIADRTMVIGWHGAGSPFHDSAQIADVSGVSLRTHMTTGSNNSSTVSFRNGNSSGNVGVVRVVLEQRIMLA